MTKIIAAIGEACNWLRLHPDATADTPGIPKFVSGTIEPAALETGLKARKSYLDPTGAVLIIDGYFITISIDVATNRVIACNATERSTAGLTFSPNGKYLLSPHLAGWFRLPTLELVRSFEAPWVPAAGAIDDRYAVLALPEDRLLKPNVSDDRVRIYDVATGARLSFIETNTEPEPLDADQRVQEIAIVGDTIISSNNSSVALHRILSGQLLASFPVVTERRHVGALFAIDRRRRHAAIATTSNQGRQQVRQAGFTVLVELETGRLLHTLKSCTVPTNYAFSDDGNRLMIGDELSACLFDVETGRLIFQSKSLGVRYQSDESDVLQEVEVHALPDEQWLLRAATNDSIVDSRGRSLWSRTSERSFGPLVTDRSAFFIYDDQILTAKHGVLRERRLTPNEWNGPWWQLPELSGTVEARLYHWAEQSVSQLCAVDRSYYLLVPRIFCSRLLGSS